MSPSVLDRLVAAATGETCGTVRRLGFSLADPLKVAFDPEPPELEMFLDWDALAVDRYAELGVH